MCDSLQTKQFISAATPGHPRTLEQMEMAEELTEFLKSFREEIWR